MVRPRRHRWVEGIPEANYYKPAGIPLRDLEETVLTVEELEAIRLADLEGLYQEHAAERMGVSRQTFGRVISDAHRKIADALVGGKALRIEGGNYKVLESAPAPGAGFGFGRGRRRGRGWRG